MLYVVSTYYKTSRKPQGSETCCALADIAQTKSSYSSGRLIKNDQPRPIVVINPRGPDSGVANVYQCRSPLPHHNSTPTNG